MTQRRTVVMASLRPSKRGLMRSPENLPRLRLMISRVESFSLTTSGSPPIWLRMSSVSQVLLLLK